MKIADIFYSEKFEKQFLGLPKNIQELAFKKEEIFRDNPFHPSLRLHQLKGNLAGHFSISINMGYRIIFKRADDGVIIFLSVGKHDIYKNL